MASFSVVFLSAILGLAVAAEEQCRLVAGEEQCDSSPSTDFGLDEQDRHTMVLLQETSLIQFQSLAGTQSGTEATAQATAAAMADLRAAIKMTSTLRQHYGPQTAKDTWHAALAEVQSAITQAGTHKAAEAAKSAQASAQQPYEGQDAAQGMQNGQLMSGTAGAMFQPQQQQQQQQQQDALSLAAASEYGQAGPPAGATPVQAGPHPPQGSPSMQQQQPMGPGAHAQGPPKGSTVTVARIAPFGKEDTATELTKHAERTQDTLVDAVENAEVAEVKRAVFRALTRLRAASIKEFDTIARLETQAIDEYNDAHHYRAENPLSYLHSSEAKVGEDKYTSFH